jgi:archaemetzincin
MPRPALSLVPIYLSDRPQLLAQLAAQLERTFSLAVEQRAPWFDPELAFDPSRGQYRSTVLLEQLLADPTDGPVRILGVTSVDLFIPVLTYVFGEAQLAGPAAVVSIHRLRSEVYGLPADPALLIERATKEAIHELGHTYGLLHCAEPRCVMRSSTYAEEIDLKSGELCAACRRRLDLARATPIVPAEDGDGPAAPPAP